MIDVVITTAQFGPLEYVDTLGTPGQALLLSSTTILLGAVALGLLPGHARNVVNTTQRSPVISLCIGLPATLVLTSLLYVGQLLATSTIGVFFAIPLIAVTATPLVVWITLGFVAVGGFFTRRLGLEQTATWTIAGGVLCSTLVVYPPIGIVVLAIAASLGVGAGARVGFGGGGLTEVEDRAIPPANKV